MGQETIRTESEQETINAGEQFGSRLKKGDVVVLKGDLGAGKTEFVKGICQFFNVEGLVTSPTFNIINQYTAKTPEGDALTIYHVDLYRIENDDELTEIGFDDMVFAHNAIKLIEWPERASEMLPESYWVVTMISDPNVDSARDISITKTVSLHA